MIVSRRFNSAAGTSLLSSLLLDLPRMSSSSSLLDSFSEANSPPTTNSPSFPLVLHNARLVGSASFTRGPRSAGREAALAVPLPPAPFERAPQPPHIPEEQQEQGNAQLPFEPELDKSEQA